MMMTNIPMDRAILTVNARAVWSDFPPSRTSLMSAIAMLTTTATNNVMIMSFINMRLRQCTKA